MSVINIISNLPQAPFSELETFVDNRMKAHLLYREGGKRMDVLITPFGDNIKGKKDVTTYVRLLPQGGVVSSSFADATIEEIVLGDNSKYFVLNTDDSRAVLPFRTNKEVLPYKIMSNAFTKTMQDAGEHLLRDFISLFELFSDLETAKRNGKKIGLGEAKSLVCKFEQTYADFVTVYAPLREPLMRAFRKTPNPCEKMGFLERKIKHYHLKDIEKYCLFPKSRSELMKGLAYSKFVLDPLKHAVFFK